MSNAIIILNYNGKQHLQKYLPSVVAHANKWRLFVADNASTDDSVSFLTENYPQIKIIGLAQNFGFADGYNQALNQLKDQFDFFFILNSDVRLSPNWDTPLLQFLIAHPEVSSVQPKILSDRNPLQFEHAGAAGGFLDTFYFPFCRGRIFDSLEEDQGQYNSIQEVTWVSGAAMLIRANDFFAVDGFDGAFFAHMEEIDLCLRLSNLGKKHFIVPQSVVYHLGGGTLSYDNPRKLFLNFRNSLWMLVKNQHRNLLLVLFIRMALDGLAAIQFLFKGKAILTWQIFLAHMALYRHFGRNYKLRQKRRHARYQYHGSIIWDYFGKQIKAFSQLNKRKFHS